MFISIISPYSREQNDNNLLRNGCKERNQDKDPNVVIF